jgi:Dyp-type peroxidase family
VTVLRHDVQGNVLRGYKRLHFASYLFCEIASVGGTRRYLKALLKASPRTEGERFAVMSDEKWPYKSKVHEALNVAFTFSGLDKLGWAEHFEQFEDFAQGMYARAERYLHDTEESAASSWVRGLRDEADVLFILYCDSVERRESRTGDLVGQLASAGMREVGRQRAGRLPQPEREGAQGAARPRPNQFGEREPFGFRDGFSQPAVAGSGAWSGEHEKGEGALKKPWRLDCWRPLKLGEFLLGHGDEEGVTPGGDDARSPSFNGTFMVWRKLEQDVDAFHSFFRSQAGADGCPLALEAKVVGRWHDGTALVKAPYAQPPPRPGPTRPSNEFDYDDDPEGARCPKGAHVRRANPRASLGWGTERTRRHRIIRRGLPYQDADRKRGLIFVCFNASINRQFELIQGSWLMDGEAFGLGREQDFLLGSRESAPTMTIHGERHQRARYLRRPDKPLVVTRGGYYLFLPGIGALKRMAKGKPPKPAPPAPSPAKLIVGLAVGVAVALGRRRGRRLSF